LVDPLEGPPAIGPRETSFWRLTMAGQELRVEMDLLDGAGPSPDRG